MNRRGFLKMLGGGVAGIAIAEAVPLGRVWSFPKVLKFIGIDLGYGDATAVTVGTIGAGNVFLAHEYVTAEYLRLLKQRLLLASVYTPAFEREFAIGNVIKVRIPRHFTAIEGAYSGGPPARPPVIQLKSPFPPLAPALGMPES